MAKGLPDLDRSLDETIRLHKAKKHAKVNSRLGRTVPPRLPLTRERDGHLKKPEKRKLPSRQPDNSRSFRQPENPSFIRQPENQPFIRQPENNTRRDASNIIITKSIPIRSAVTSGGSILIKRNMLVKKKETVSRVEPMRDERQEMGTSFSREGEKQVIPHQPISKHIVLICNLDPRATASDVGETCKVFGPVLSCDMLVDPMGRPLCEAEIEFMYPDSAERCVAELDNNYADGRILRAKLQSAPTVSVAPRYASRTVAASARVNSQHSSDFIRR